MDTIGQSRPPADQGVKTGKREPLTENFLEDFGPASPAFQHASTLWLETIAAIRDQPGFESIYAKWREELQVSYGTSAGNEQLFVRHTYLATLAKLLAYLWITGAQSAPHEAETQEIIQGTFFAKQQITSFPEDDFFSWVARAPVVSRTQEITSHLASLLFAYRLSALSEDVLKELYQTLVDPKDRHNFGEYYTPDWLAARMCNVLLGASGRDVVLDPACGSGTFLFQAIRHKRTHLPATRQSLKRILGSVVGIDIHPLAVIVAKVNVLLALGDLLRKNSGPIHIQVYLADSLRPPSFTPTLAPLEERVARDGAFTSRRGPGEGVAELHPTAWPPRDVGPSESDSDSLLNRFDAVIGNPPWLSFRFVEKGEYQDFLKQLMVKEMGLAVGAGHLITHLELATLFFARCARLYLKPSGKIGLVLPRSIFSADQHDRFRRSCGTGGATLTELWDLEGVSPLFRVPAAVVFGNLSKRRPGHHWRVKSCRES